MQAWPLFPPSSEMYIQLLASGLHLCVCRDGNFAYWYDGWQEGIRSYLLAHEHLILILTVHITELSNKNTYECDAMELIIYFLLF